MTMMIERHAASQLRGKGDLPKDAARIHAMTFGPVPTKQVFLYQIPELQPGCKIRFLGWYFSRVLWTSTSVHSAKQ
jgi:hypothetical protein